MQPLNILWLTALPHPREGVPGAPWLVALLAELARRPADLTLTVLGTASEMAAPIEHYEVAGIRYVYLEVPVQRQDILSLYRQRLASLTNYVRQHAAEYDLVHVHGSEAQLHVAAVGLPRPVLVSVQGIVWEYLKALPLNTDQPRRLLWLLASYYELRYLPRVRDFSCRTHWDTAQSLRLSPGSHVHLNWEVIRPEFFALNAVATPAPAPGRPYLLFLVGSQVMKGYRETLEAFDLIRRQIPAKLLVLGPTEPGVIERHIRRRGLTAIGPDDVELRGQQPLAELVRLLPQAFCLLHPSYLDNSPNSVCEAQVAGLPVVATMVGGVGSLVEHERTGLATRRDPRDIADQVLRLYHDEPLRQRLGQEARRVAQQRHDPQVLTQRTIDIYRAILAREQPANFAAFAPAVAAPLHAAASPLSAS